MTVYKPPTLGDDLDGMRWTGDSWTPICPACNVAMTELNDRAELCCPVCGVSHLERVRGRR